MKITNNNIKIAFLRLDKSLKKSESDQFNFSPKNKNINRPETKKNVIQIVNEIIEM